MKKSLILVLAMLITVSLFACGKKTDGKETGSNEQTKTETKENQEKTKAETKDNQKNTEAGTVDFETELNSLQELYDNAVAKYYDILKNGGVVDEEFIGFYNEIKEAAGKSSEKVKESALYVQITDRLTKWDEDIKLYDIACRIKTLDPDSEHIIEEMTELLKEEYDALSEAEKIIVEAYNKDLFRKYERALKIIAAVDDLENYTGKALQKKVAAVENAIKSFGLPENFITKSDEIAYYTKKGNAGYVTELIEKIEKVTYDELAQKRSVNLFKMSVEDALKAYEALTDEEKLMVEGTEWMNAAYSYALAAPLEYAITQIIQSTNEISEKRYFEEALEVYKQTGSDAMAIVRNLDTFFEYAEKYSYILYDGQMTFESIERTLKMAGNAMVNSLKNSSGYGDYNYFVKQNDDTYVLTLQTSVNGIHALYASNVSDIRNFENGNLQIAYGQLKEALLQTEENIFKGKIKCAFILQITDETNPQAVLVEVGPDGTKSSVE